jgi:hypothetical protein
MYTMKRTITIVFLSFVLTALVMMIAWAGYRAVTVRKDNIRRINDKIGLFNESFSGGILSEKGSATQELRKKAQALFAEEGRLQSLVVYSKRDGIIYKTSLSDEKKLNDQINALPDRLLPPTLKLNGFYNFSRTGEITDKGGNKLYLFYVFESLGRADIVYVLQICLIVVIALTLLTLIMIMITSRIGTGRPVAAASDGLKSAPAKAPPIKREIRRAPGPEEDFAATGDDSGLDGDLNLDGLDLDDTEGSPADDGDFSLDSLGLDDTGTPSADDGDFSLDGLNLDDDNLDDASFGALDEETESEDRALKELIPDIPEEEDLRSMDHERREPRTVELEEDLDLPTLEDSLDDNMGEDPAQKSLYSPKSGFCWESFLPERLKNELDRATADNEDILLILFQDVETTDEDFIVELAGMLRENYPQNDMNFEYTDSGYAVIVQNTEMDAGIAQLEELLKRWNEMKSVKSVRVGLSARCGRLVEADRLLKEAESALSKASDENPIVGFRPDPEKFRQFISKNLQDT